MLLAQAFMVLLPSLVLVVAEPLPTLPLDFPVSSPQTPPPSGFGYGGALHANEPTILFVNFDGAQLSSGCGNNPKNNCSNLAGTFGGQIYPYSGSVGLQASLVQGVRSDVADFGVAVTDERPAATEDYAMVLVGESANGGSAEHGFAGVAPSIDCGNSNPNITSFDLVGSITVINQEAAHTWGLEHVNEKADNLYPTSGGVSDPQYLDMCMKIVSDTMLNPSNGQCNSVHTMFCNNSYQNSYQEMLYLFGAGTPDVIAPEATIDQPSEGETLPYPASFNLVVTLSDNETPQMMQTSILLDGTEVIGGDFVASTLSFPVDGGIPEGTHTWRVETQDEGGNAAFDEVTFHVGMAGSTTDPTAGTSSTTTDGSGTTTDGSASGTGGNTDPSGTATMGDPTTGSSGSSDGATDSDSDSGGATTDNSGCGCRSAAPMGSAVAPLLFLLLAVRRRR